MFREMRRSKQYIPDDEVTEILNKGSYGILGVSGDYGYPYTVPLNYIYINDKIYFHCAKEGHKLDAIKKNNKVSFCVVARSDVDSEKFTTKYKSVIVFGKAEIIVGRSIVPIMKEFAQKYSYDFMEKAEQYINSSVNSMAVVQITAEYITGKEGSMLAKERNTY